MQRITNATRAKDMEINAKKGRIEIPKDGKEKNYLARSGARFFSFWRVKILLLAPKAKFSRATFFET